MCGCSDDGAARDAARTTVDARVAGDAKRIDAAVPLKQLGIQWERMPSVPPPTVRDAVVTANGVVTIVRDTLILLSPEGEELGRADTADGEPRPNVAVALARDSGDLAVLYGVFEANLFVTIYDGADLTEGATVSIPTTSPLAASMAELDGTLYVLVLEDLTEHRMRLYTVLEGGPVGSAPLSSGTEYLVGGRGLASVDGHLLFCAMREQPGAFSELPVLLTVDPVAVAFTELPLAAAGRSPSAACGVVATSTGIGALWQERIDGEVVLSAAALDENGAAILAGPHRGAVTNNAIASQVAFDGRDLLVLDRLADPDALVVHRFAAANAEAQRTCQVPLAPGEGAQDGAAIAATPSGFYAAFAPFVGLEPQQLRVLRLEPPQR